MRLRGAAVALALAACVGAGSGPVRAQAAVPGTQQMIEALKPSANRGRNLVVRQTPQTPQAPVAPPPLSPLPPASAPAPAPAPPGPVAPPPLVDDAPPGLSLPIQFEANSSRVRPESGPLLGDLVAAMISPELKDNRFVIEGHTDARGNAAANRRLSQERAEEVRQYLILLGVHASRLQAVGKGASEPLNRKDPMSAENRRVRVVTIE